MKWKAGMEEAPKHCRSALLAQQRETLLNIINVVKGLRPTSEGYSLISASRSPAHRYRICTHTHINSHTLTFTHIYTCEYIHTYVHSDMQTHM